VLAHSAKENDDDIALAAAEGKSLAQINLENLPEPEESEGVEEVAAAITPRPLQFSVLDLLILFTFTAIGLAAVRWLPPGYFAGTAGFLAFAALVTAGVWRSKSSVVRVLIWSVVTVYFAAALGATVLQWRSPGEAQPPHSRPASQQTGQPLQ
jgi:hypothetical protein